MPIRRPLRARGNRTTQAPPATFLTQGSQSGFVDYSSSSSGERYLTTCAGVTAGRHNGSRRVTATRGLIRPSAPELRSRVVVRRDTHDPRYARDSTRVADVSWKDRLVSKGGKNAARLASSRVGVLEVSNCRDDGENKKYAPAKVVSASSSVSPPCARAYPRFPARRGNSIVTLLRRLRDVRHILTSRHPHSSLSTTGVRKRCGHIRRRWSPRSGDAEGGG